MIGSEQFEPTVNCFINIYTTVAYILERKFD